MLYLSEAQCQTMAAAAIAAYPQECCGILLGHFRENGDLQATEIRPVPNAWTLELEAEHWAIHGEAIAATSPPDHSPQDHSPQDHSPQDRFAIDPRDLLKAQKDARRQNWQIIGIYHSHPDHPAVPSERDRQSAWPDYSYLILSVTKSAIADSQSWRLNDHHQFIPEPWQLQPALRLT